MDLATIFSTLPNAPTQTSLIIYFGVIAWCVIGTVILPGPWVTGTKLKDGSYIHYKINSLYVHFVGCALYVLFSSVGLNYFPADIVIREFSSLLSTSIFWAIFFTIFLFARAIVTNKPLALHSKNLFLNLWYGIELNPFIFGFEIKEFSYRPAFCLHHIIVISGGLQQYQQYGYLSAGMIVYQAITLFYILDWAWFEAGVILMFDIIEENFGFMLIMGDYIWMPFVFSCQIFFLMKPSEHSLVYHAINVVVFALGYWIFRGANGQKNQFRRDPTALIWGERPRVIETGVPGKNLLISGWWGVARKINYAGDLLIAVAWAMPCGFDYIFGWIYPIYLTALLLHRAMRDDARCAEKYKGVWKQYCAKVPYQIIPYIY